MRADAFVSAWKWLEELLNLNKVGTVEQVYPMYWTLAEAGECHANVSAYAQVHGEEWERVFAVEPGADVPPECSRAAEVHGARVGIGRRYGGRGVR